MNISKPFFKFCFTCDVESTETIIEHDELLIYGDLGYAVRDWLADRPEFKNYMKDYEAFELINYSVVLNNFKGFNDRRDVMFLIIADLCLYKSYDPDEARITVFCDRNADIIDAEFDTLTSGNKLLFRIKER